MGIYADVRQPAALIATLGTEPQVVTATLDILLKQGEEIKDVTVIHTTLPASPIGNAIEVLDKAFGSSSYRGKFAWHLMPIETAQGNLVQDVVAPSETQSAFRCLYNIVREKKNAGYRVHLSIAGGRKTLSVFGMVVAQLLFDEGDRLWYLYSGGPFLESKRLHPNPDDAVHLVSIPVVHWSKVAPILLDFASIEDPQEALERQQALRLSERLEDSRAFILGALSPAEERVVSLLVQEGLGDQALAVRLHLSPRTIEEHLRSAYRKTADHWGLAQVSRTQLIALLNLYYSTQITGNPA